MPDNSQDNNVLMNCTNILDQACKSSGCDDQLNILTWKVHTHVFLYCNTDLKKVYLKCSKHNLAVQRLEKDPFMSRKGPVVG